MSVRRTALAVVVIGAVALAAASPGDPPVMAKPLSLEEALVKARVNGKYSMLLRQFNRHPDLKGLRQDPRFQQLIADAK